MVLVLVVIWRMILSKGQDDSGRCWLVKVTCLKKVKIMIVMTLMFATVGVGWVVTVTAMMIVA